MTSNLTRSAVRPAEAPDSGPGESGSAAAPGHLPPFRRALARPYARHLLLIAVYLAAGVAATWPRALWLADGKLPRTSDVAMYVWDMWWMAHQLVHLGNPFFTRYMAAPAGTSLAYDTLLPLPGWVMAPVTLVFGPSASYTLLTIVAPGLLCYVMYRLAKLWLNEAGAVVAGAFFGLSSMLLWQDWYHLNIALGTIFLPVTIEAAVRLRRNPSAAPAIALGAALGASVLVNQESAVLAFILAAIIVVSWAVPVLTRHREMLPRAVRTLAICAACAVIAGGPGLIALIQANASGAAHIAPADLATYYSQFGVPLQTLFAPSPRLGTFGLGSLSSAYGYTDHAQIREGLATFGVVLSALALLGVAAGWRRRSTWAFAALWLAASVLALGTSLQIGMCHMSVWRRPGTSWGSTCHQYLPLLTRSILARVRSPGGPPGSSVLKPLAESNLMPYTWLVRLPVLDGLREADRFALAGLVAAALLAGLAVQWLSRRRVTRPLIALVVALGALEAGWSGATPASLGYPGVMPTAIAGITRVLGSDHSDSIVVDVPYGMRGGVNMTGHRTDPRALVVATADGHPRAISVTSWVSPAAIKMMARYPFFRHLDTAQRGRAVSAAAVLQARSDLGTLHVGWVVLWPDGRSAHQLLVRQADTSLYLVAVGFSRISSVCVAGGTSQGDACPLRDQVWLFRYEPAARGGGPATRP